MGENEYKNPLWKNSEITQGDWEKIGLLDFADYATAGSQEVAKGLYSLISNDPIDDNKYEEIKKEVESAIDNVYETRKKVAENEYEPEEGNGTEEGIDYSNLPDEVKEEFYESIDLGELGDRLEMIIELQENLEEYENRVEDL